MPIWNNFNFKQLNLPSVNTSSTSTDGTTEGTDIINSLHSYKEIESRVNQIISDYKNGNISLKEALKRLSAEPICINPAVSEENGAKVYKFDLNKKTYVIREIKDDKTARYSEMNNYNNQFSKTFIQSLVDTKILKYVDGEKYEFDKDRAISRLNDLGIDTKDVNNIYDFIEKLPKINESKGKNSTDMKVYSDHPELFLKGTVGGPFRAIDIKAVREFFKDYPELIKTIRDAESLQKAIEKKEKSDATKVTVNPSEQKEEPITINNVEVKPTTEEVITEPINQEDTPSEEVVIPTVVVEPEVINVGTNPNTVSISDMNNAKNMYSKTFVDSLVILGVLKNIDSENFEFDKTKAEDILKEFGIKAEVNDIFEFVSKMPKISEATTKDSADNQLLREHPEFFVKGTFGGPFHLIDINAIKEYFADNPELVSTIRDGETLKKAIEIKTASEGLDLESEENKENNIFEDSDIVIATKDPDVKPEEIEEVCKALDNGNFKVLNDFKNALRLGASVSTDKNGNFKVNINGKTYTFQKNIETIAVFGIYLPSVMAEKATPEELNKYIDASVESITKELKAKYNYSDEYIKLLIKTASAEFQDFTDVFNRVKNNFDGDLYQSALKFRNNMNELLDKNSFSLSKYENSQPETYDIFVMHIAGSGNAGSLQADLLRKTFESIFAEQNLSLYNEKEAFVMQVMKNIVNQIGISGSLESDGWQNFYNNFIKLDSNGNGNWVEELCQIALKEASKIKTVDDSTASSINAEKLFEAEKNMYYAKIIPSEPTLSAEKIVSQLDILLFSDDPGTRRFAKTLYSIFTQYKVTEYDEVEMVNAVLRLLGKECGVKMQEPPCLTEDIVNRLNENNLFEKLEKIAKSSELITEYQCGSVDGEIDDFGQGKSGDCWLLAGLISLTSSPIGREIVKDSIKQNPDGSFTVTFKGIGISYTITAMELVEAQQSGVYSTGDNDVLVLELATQKLREDMFSGKVHLDYGQKDSANDPGEYENGISDSIWGGKAKDFIYYMTGKTSTDITALMYILGRSYREQIIRDVMWGNAVLSFSLDANEHEATTTSGSTFKFGGDRGYGHAFAISRVTNETVTIVNPWNSDQEITFTWDEFLKLSPRLYYTELV